MEVRKSKYDDKEYRLVPLGCGVCSPSFLYISLSHTHRAVQLENGLRVLLVSDPSCQSSNAEEEEEEEDCRENVSTEENGSDEEDDESESDDDGGVESQEDTDHHEHGRWRRKSRTKLFTSVCIKIINKNIKSLLMTA